MEGHAKVKQGPQVCLESFLEMGGELGHTVQNDGHRNPMKPDYIINIELSILRGAIGSLYRKEVS